jgi:hypothetical protein
LDVLLILTPTLWMDLSPWVFPRMNCPCAQAQLPTRRLNPHMLSWRVYVCCRTSMSNLRKVPFKPRSK